MAVAVLAAVLGGCGGEAPAQNAPVVLRSGDLPGWSAVQASPGIGELAPDLDGLAVEARTDAPALVRAGDVVRAVTFALGSAADASTALERAGAPAYVDFLTRAFRAEPSGSAASGYRIRVPRQAAPGSDTVELFVLRRGPVFAVVELVSANGFDPSLRQRVLDLIRSRL